MRVAADDSNILDQPRGLEDLLVLLLEFRRGQLGRLFPTPALVDLKERVTNMLKHKVRTLHTLVRTYSRCGYG